MKKKKSQHGSIARVARAAVALACVLVTFPVSADSGDSTCLGLYGKSGATPGTSACVLTVTSNTPSGMGSSGCRNNQPLIESWCGTPSPVDPDKNCAAADPVLPANGVTTISETDFISGDDVPLAFSRSYRSSPFIKTDAGIGASWFHNWQRHLGLANVSASSPQVSAYRSDGNRVTFAKAGGRVESHRWLTTKSDAAIVFVDAERPAYGHQRDVFGSRGFAVGQYTNEHDDYFGL